MADFNRIKLTMAFDAEVHAAMTSLAHDRRRSFTAEVQTACDEHLARAGVTTSTTTATEQEHHA